MLPLRPQNLGARASWATVPLLIVLCVLTLPRRRSRRSFPALVDTFTMPFAVWCSCLPQPICTSIASETNQVPKTGCGSTARCMLFINRSSYLLLRAPHWTRLSEHGNPARDVPKRQFPPVAATVN
ncbi:hypothetical protein B0H15DRAFT_28463 [Mycena belliarum]|uniref:Uncharacterized protein n=1 Tax=Mycena belliarum TaxID=1033014 RepID=A0AAD6Y0D9_9AGAR|nr:hypothetical protein B0H15DRAFT_28463 [Mycena belliae]